MTLIFGIVIGIILTIVGMFGFLLVITLMYGGKNSPKCEMCDDKQFPGNDDKCPLCRRSRDW